MAKPPMTYRVSPNYWPTNSGRRLISLHGTAGSAGSALGWLCNPASESSANFLIELSGKIWCLVDPERGWSAWANGPLNQPDLSNRYIKECSVNKINPNRVCISIEHERSSASMIAGETMPKAQQDASNALVLWLCERFGIPVSRENIVGHWQFDKVNRPYCPGFDMDKYVAQLQKGPVAPPMPTNPPPPVSSIQMNGFTIKGAILDTWKREPNPVRVFGLPMTDEYTGTSGLIEQVFERAVLQFFPERYPDEWSVVGLPLGTWYLQTLRNGAK